MLLLLQELLKVRLPLLELFSQHERSKMIGNWSSFLDTVLACAGAGLNLISGSGGENAGERNCGRGLLVVT